VVDQAGRQLSTHLVAYHKLLKFFRRSNTSVPRTINLDCNNSSLPLKPSVEFQPLFNTSPVWYPTSSSSAQSSTTGTTCYTNTCHLRHQPHRTTTCDPGYTIDNCPTIPVISQTATSSSASCIMKCINRQTSILCNLSIAC